MLKLIKSNQKNFLSQLNFILEKRKLQNPNIEKKIIALIPARQGSERIKHKNIIFNSNIIYFIDLEGDGFKIEDNLSKIKFKVEFSTGGRELTNVCFEQTKLEIVVSCANKGVKLFDSN